MKTKHTQDYLTSITVAGSVLFLGHLWVCYVVQEPNLIMLLLNSKFTGTPFSTSMALGVSALIIVLLGLLSDAMRPFFKKYVNLTPEKENLFAELNPEAKALLTQEGLFPLLERLATGDVTPSFRAKLNYRIYFLARRWSDYLNVGADLHITDFLADFYAKLYVSTSLLTVFATLEFWWHAIPLFISQGQAYSLTLACLSSISFGLLAIAFGTRCRTAIFQTFFHAQNLVNDLPFLLKLNQGNDLWDAGKGKVVREQIALQQEKGLLPDDQQPKLEI